MKSDHKSRLKLETSDAFMQASLCRLPMENVDWARMFDTWESTENRMALPLELEDDSVHYVRNLNYFSARASTIE